MTIYCDESGGLNAGAMTFAAAMLSSEAAAVIHARFRAVTGTTPHQWLLSQRILFAQRMLETGDDPIELIASRAGFGSAANLRHHFAREVSASPLAYRRTFRGEAAS